MTFKQKIEGIQQKNNSLLCIGLDPVVEKIPGHLKKESNPFFVFNKAIIDATHEYVCAYKPNSAFYEALGEKGIGELKKTCDYLCNNYPEIPIIFDAKRADLANTNKGYVTFAFDYLRADAITLHPYLGQEAIQPFLDRRDKGCIILCRTSNSGAKEFQDLPVNGESLFRIVAKQISKNWNTNNNCFLVVGATYPEELAEIRKIVGDMILLVPGIGAQGGSVERSVKAGMRTDRKGIIMSTSRVILFASSGKDFAKRAGEEAQKVGDEINRYR